MVYALCSMFFVLLFSASLSAQSLKVPYAGLSGTQWPLWIAKSAGKLDAELIYIPGGSLMIQTLFSGEAQLGSQSPTTAVRAWGNGANLVLVAGGIDRVLNVLMVSPKISRVEDLRGKKLGVSRFGSLSDWSLREALRPYKDLKDVAVVQAGGLGERMAALAAGALDGTMLQVDQAYQVEKLGYRVLVDLKNLRIPFQGIVASKQFVRSHREEVKNFLKSYVEGIKILKADREFSMAVLGKQLKINDREVLLRTYAVYKYAWESQPYVSREGIVRALDTMPDLTPKKLNPGDFIDNSIMREILAP